MLGAEKQLSQKGERKRRGNDKRTSTSRGGVQLWGRNEPGNPQEIRAVGGLIRLSGVGACNPTGLSGRKEPTASQDRVKKNEVFHRGI